VTPEMAATDRGDHLSLTADSFRQEAISVAVIKQVEDLSPTVKKLTLIPQQPKEVVFKAGQWVDFFIPEVSTVGGFSMCSAPQTLLEEGTLELAVKYSNHPPAKWVHTKCRPGDSAGLKVGGNFFFDPLSFSAPPSPRSSNSLSSPISAESLFLVAGGVGINPILSILEEFSANVNKGTISSTAKATLLYSASKREELLFKDRIDSLVKSVPGVVVDYFVTRETPPPVSTESTSPYIWRRISKSDLKTKLAGHSSQSYLCGPPSMIDSLVESLRDIGVADERIHFEKWW